jgi:hypothetical protein
MIPSALIVCFSFCRFAAGGFQQFLDGRQI